MAGKFNADVVIINQVLEALDSLRNYCVASGIV